VGVPEAYDAAGMQDCHGQLRMCMQRIADVEAINVDLESRLEAQAREYIDFESEAADSLVHWKAQYGVLVTEGANWKRLHEQLKLKNKKIREQLLRTERELHGILQKKYDIMEYARRVERDRIRAEQCATVGFRTLPTIPYSRISGIEPTFPNLLDLTACTQNSEKDNSQDHRNPLGAPPQDVRRGRVVLGLADFFEFQLGDSNLEPRGF